MLKKSSHIHFLESRSLCFLLRQMGKCQRVPSPSEVSSLVF
ncbi:rCG24059 [Rattus norvegicus]|uniref:RCG24059 n=1 Tax=Rattus norvegicus TaxID=10116 RepID=A6JSU5_RAT|nr:rCG24059 [Rattus norvegicus]